MSRSLSVFTVDPNIAATNAAHARDTDMHKSTPCAHGLGSAADSCVVCLHSRIDNLETELKLAREWIVDATSFINVALPELKAIVETKMGTTSLPRQT